MEYNIVDSTTSRAQTAAKNLHQHALAYNRAVSALAKRRTNTDIDTIVSLSSLFAPELEDASAELTRAQVDVSNRLANAKQILWRCIDRYQDVELCGKYLSFFPEDIGGDLVASPDLLFNAPCVCVSGDGVEITWEFIKALGIPPEVAIVVPMSEWKEIVSQSTVKEWHLLHFVRGPLPDAKFEQILAMKAKYGFIECGAVSLISAATEEKIKSLPHRTEEPLRVGRSSVFQVPSIQIMGLALPSAAAALPQINWSSNAFRLKGAFPSAQEWNNSFGCVYLAQIMRLWGSRHIDATLHREDIAKMLSILAKLTRDPYWAMCMVRIRPVLTHANLIEPIAVLVEAPKPDFLRDFQLPPNITMLNEYTARAWRAKNASTPLFCIYVVSLDMLTKKRSIIEKLLEAMITNNQLEDCALFVIRETLDPTQMMLPYSITIPTSKTGADKKVPVFELCKHPKKSDMSILEWQPARYTNMSVAREERQDDFPGAWNTVMIPFLTLSMFNKWSQSVRAFKIAKDKADSSRSVSSSYV